MLSETGDRTGEIVLGDLISRRQTTSTGNQGAVGGDNANEDATVAVAEGGTVVVDELCDEFGKIEPEKDRQSSNEE